MPTQFPERDLGPLLPGQKLIFGSLGPTNASSSVRPTTMVEAEGSERLTKRDKGARKRIEKRQRKLAMQLEKFANANERASHKNAEGEEEESQPVEEEEEQQDKDAGVKAVSQNDLLKRRENFNWFEDGDDDDDEEDSIEPVGHLEARPTSPAQDSEVMGLDSCVQKTGSPEENVTDEMAESESVQALSEPETHAAVQDNEQPDTQEEDVEQADIGNGDLNSEADNEPIVEHIEYAEAVPDLSGDSEVISPVVGPITPSDIAEQPVDIANEVANVLEQTGHSEIMAEAEQTKEDPARQDLAGADMINIAIAEDDDIPPSEGQLRPLTPIPEEEEMDPDLDRQSKVTSLDAGEDEQDDTVGKSKDLTSSVSEETGQLNASASSASGEMPVWNWTEDAAATEAVEKSPGEARDIDFSTLPSDHNQRQVKQTQNWTKIAVAVPRSFQPNNVARPATRPTSPTLMLLSSSQDIESGAISADPCLLPWLPTQNIAKILEETALGQPGLDFETTPASPAIVQTTPTTLKNDRVEKVPANLQEAEKAWGYVSPNNEEKSQKDKKAKQSAQPVKSNIKAKRKSVHWGDETNPANTFQDTLGRAKEMGDEGSIKEHQVHTEEESNKEGHDNKQRSQMTDGQPTAGTKKQSYANRARSKKRKSKTATTVQEPMAEPAGNQFAQILRLLSMLGAFFSAVYIFMFVGKGLLDSARAQREL